MEAKELLSKTAVVVLNYNGAKLLRQFLPTLISCSDSARIYVIDNASTDDSVSLLETEFPAVVCIKNAQNLGFAGGYNEGLRSIDASLLVLINSDVEVTPNWLQPLVRAFAEEEKLAIAQPKIRDFKNKAAFEYAGAAGGFIDKYGFPYCRGRLFETVEIDENQYSDETPIFWATGACFAIRKKVFDELGGFDADFFAHQEEIDLCWRAFNRGFEARYLPDSVVFHVGGATLASGSARKVFLNFRNSLVMLLKNVPQGMLFEVLFLRLVLDGIAAIRFLTSGEFSKFRAVIAAHFAFYANCNQTFKKRAKHLRSDYFSKKSIVYAYFVQGKRRYSDVS
ncbi:glycosyltransferase family 2 protein [Flavobacterium aurantiibacter]|uniref:dTDP-Rha--alpha-D-GlcNAc-pyrophosphate polyprenol alpha-3-L-rhamnosyltransferase n=1 Tax=Flavobacterium aurantiibacter TaxID=2023067 RepID=A0A255ZTW3_9FLAO|nr:glycosyltransferase family 2 protein [Flavobacterium aurantiibacter]OYQ44861.1 dTDP-Rha--alpha-D-GlcNAc-pyrophosphate polyprenol alpha-3-L-rhamnosyltransferase [Flavobacterium aurantiibacter]